MVIAALDTVISASHMVKVAIDVVIFGLDEIAVAHEVVRVGKDWVAISLDLVVGSVDSKVVFRSIAEIGEIHQQESSVSVAWNKVSHGSLRVARHLKVEVDSLVDRGGVGVEVNKWENVILQ